MTEKPRDIPQELWDASYGALGMALYVWPRDAGIRLVGVWPEPVTAQQSGLAVPLDDQVTRVQARELLHTPTRFTVRGRDDVRELDHVDFLQLVGAGDPAYREVELEVTPTAEWYDPPEQAGDGIVQRGYNKLNGELNRTLELTTANVTVRETVDGVPFVREWAGVATGYKYTETTFDPSSAGCTTGPSFSAASCSPASPSSCAWKRSSKLTAGSWKPVIAEYGMTSFDGTWLKLSPTEKRSSSTSRSQ